MSNVRKRLFEEDVSQIVLWSCMLEYFTDRYIDLALARLGTEVLDEQRRFSIRLYRYGAVGMTREWLLHDNITSIITSMIIGITLIFMRSLML